MSTAATQWTRGIKLLSWPVVEQFASPLMQLVITPLLLHRVAAEEFAFWVLALSLVVAAPVWSLGRSSALLVTIPRFAESERHARAVSLIARTLRLIAVLAGIAAAAVATLGELLGRLWPMAAEASGVVVMTIVFLAVTEAENVVGAGLKSYRAFDQSAKIELAGRLLQLLVLVGVVTTRTSAIELLAIAIATGLLKFAAKWLVFRRHQAHVPRSAAAQGRTPAPADFKQIGLWSLVQVLSGIAFYSFDRWVVGYYMGSATLSAYFVCNQLAQLAHAVPAAASQALIPWAASRHAALSGPEQGKRLGKVVVFGSLLAAVPSLVVLALAPQLLAIWISPSFSAEHSLVLRHLAVVFLLLSLNIPSFAMLVGFGHARWTAVISVAAGIVYMAATLLVEPGGPLLMADLKLVYALLSLFLIFKLFRVLAELRKA
jgi:O-antigen/teichoic acid export membrane protein